MQLVAVVACQAAILLLPTGILCIIMHNGEQFAVAQGSCRHLGRTNWVQIVAILLTGLISYKKFS